MNTPPVIERVTQVTDELVSAFERLIPQLSPTTRPPKRDVLVQVVSSSNTYLYIARDPDRNNEVVGTLTLVLYRTPTALHAWIEDVVVDETARGKGTGTKLTNAGLQQAAQAGAKCVNLTSRPSRVAANRLYQNLGFERRKTNAYRYNLSTQNECNES
jgi:ribosomal protein S18 acetylase RimI-like enzyme